MKKIIFVRHGKAEEVSSGICDIERSLTIKGKVISRLMAKRLMGMEKSPVTLISSPAFRALETALIFAMEFGIAAEKININSNIYYKMNLRHLSEILAQAGEHCNAVILFGHNPSFTEIANSLSHDGCDFMPKSGVLGLSFDVSTWPEIRQNTGKQLFYLIPEKDL